MKRPTTLGAAALTAAVLALSACGDEPEAAAAAKPVKQPVTVTYDGGILVLDGESLAVAHRIDLDGFNRVNPAGDDEHVFVSTTDGFRVLDAVDGTMTGISYPGAKPGHVVRHGDRTILFTDGTGEVNSFDPADLAQGKPSGRTYRTATPHHGVAVELADGTLVVTLGTEESRPGAIALDATGKEIARNEDCDGVHGEAVAKDDVVALGCNDGVLLYKGGKFVKVDGGREYARTGNQSGSDVSPVLLGDYKVEPDAELERPTHFSLIDTAANRLRAVPMPAGVSYTFRSLGRGPGARR